MLDSINDSKRALRQTMRAKLAALDECDMSQMSALMIARLLDQRDWLRPGARVTLFGGIPGEPDLTSLIPWLLAHQMQPVLFGFANGELVPQLVTSFEDLTRGLFDVFIPRPECEVIDATTLDVILTPGLAFDAECMRLGRGKGHFDRLFAQTGTRAQRIGVCFECQMVDSVPAEPHDARLDAVVTERRLIVSR